LRRREYNSREWWARGPANLLNEKNYEGTAKENIEVAVLTKEGKKSGRGKKDRGTPRV